MLYSLLLIACGSARLVLAGYPQRSLEMAEASFQPRTTAHRQRTIAPLQALQRRGDTPDRSTHSQSGQSSQSHSGPVRQSQTNQSSGRPAMPRFPSPSNSDGNAMPRNPHPRIALEAKGPAAIATKSGTEGVAQRYYVVPGPPHRAHEAHPEKAMAAAFSHSTAPHAAEDQPYAQHALKMHAQGKTARLDFKVPLGGKGSYTHESAEGESGGWHIPGGRKLRVEATSKHPQGAHVYGSVTRGGRITAQATNKDKGVPPSPESSPDLGIDSHPPPI